LPDVQRFGFRPVAASTNIADMSFTLGRTLGGSASRPRRSRLAVGAGLLAAAVGASIAAVGPAQATQTPQHNPGSKIKHVWLIILENKSYDATFTGLNDNTYLWRTLPSQGVLVKNYYGTGHFSLDNYTSMVSGQAPAVDNQADCPLYKDLSGTVVTDPKDPNYGQLKTAGAAYAAGQGCVYPASVPTLFNQLDAAGTSWKSYAQDLGNNPTREAGACGSPGSPAGAGVADPGSATPTDQYVPKHFPLPWFHSVIDNPADCNAAHVANLFDPANGLYHDLQSASTTPAFSWISPNNCSDAHDAVCKGNNLSGGFSDPNTPNPPVNYTGGLYAADLFLEHVVPMIEKSAAFKQGGLIDITFDEGFPPFTFTGNSFANSKKVPATAVTSIASDSAGENLNGHNVAFEPTGPNTPLAVDSKGNQLYPGPGDNAFVDRDPTIPGIVLGGAGTPPGARTDAAATGTATSSTITDNAAVITDEGRTVTGTNIPAGATVGKVVDKPTTATQPAGATPPNPGAIADLGSFTLLVNGKPALPTGPVSGVTLGARSTATDPLFDATHATTGGGQVGSVLISPYIEPGSVSTTYYNHYSWLRTMEDIFGVAQASPGLDGKGHIGFAAQPGLAAFGRDVFTRS
jgi:Phosphoesterase family